MTVSEQHRRNLQEALVETLGPDPADTLMHYLPPVGWADVATKHDVDVACQMLRLEWNASLHRELRSQTYHLMGFFVGLQAVVIAATKLI